MFTAAILVLAIAQGAAAQPPQTDQTVPVQRGARLTINNFAGEVVLHTWDRDSVHVVARHQEQTRVNIRQGAAGVSISAGGRRGPVGSVDYDITAPKWMPVKVDGTYNFITIDGAQAEVTAESVRGDITIKGGTGFVTAKSIEGSVSVTGAQGKINASSVNRGVKIVDASGDITAEAIDGSVELLGITSRSVEASSVDGAIIYQGTIADGGRYSFASHDGGVMLDIPATSNATVTVRIYDGSYASTIPALQPPDRDAMNRGKRVTMTMGNGSADIEVESFDGAVRIGPGASRRGSRD